MKYAESWVCGCPTPKLGVFLGKARKLLNKANPLKRAAFLEKLEPLLDDALHQPALRVYMVALPSSLTTGLIDRPITYPGFAPQLKSPVSQSPE